ncbi:NAD(P)-dependent alcohol dehydrogenase [Cryobacterium sp. BB736]|uniref:NAD(P)-dependent alcohol dehydrogenase n=1 Tax=Cryobacterium sp. BB736 TaxID=2746963 RepID=UPI001D0BE615|nr:NAD(P)-dependent alcohol dehydrogenase [Cryobacterium sp. BB736]
MNTSTTNKKPDAERHERRMMKAATQDRYGDADVITISDVPVPEVGDEDVLLKVHAAGVDPGAWHLMTGKPYLMRLFGVGFTRPKQKTRGSDVSGTVVAVGASVTEFAVGDEVFGVATGSFAEYAVSKERWLVRKSASVSFEEAATIATSAVTALQALRNGKLEEGQRVLVIGASGGVGSFAVQLAKSMGATVTAVCSTRNIERVRALGADEVIDYTTQTLEATAHDFDLVLDIAGSRSVSVLRRMLAERGALVLVGGEGGGNILGAVTRNLTIAAQAPFVKQRLLGMFAMVRKDDLEVLRRHVEAGALRPLIDTVYPLEAAADALRHVGSNHARGKIVLSVTPSV